MESIPVRLFVRAIVCSVFLGLFAGRADAGQYGFVYALQQVNGGTNQIYGFRFEPATGALSLLPGFPVGSGGTGTAATSNEHLAYRQGRLFVVNDGSDTLTAFSVNRVTGALTAMPFSPVTLGAGSWACVDAAPSGSGTLVVVGNGNGGISSFAVTASTATAAPGSPFSTGAAMPFSCEFSPGGSSVYTGGNFGTAIAAFLVAPGNGALAPFAGSPVDSGLSFPVGYATDDQFRMFVAAGSSVRAFTVGGLPVGVFPIAASGLLSGTHGLWHPAGYYIVADRSGNRVGSYMIGGSGSSTTLTAAPGSPYNSGGFAPSSLALTADGGHLFAANSTTRNLMVFAVNQVNGTLASTVIQPANTLGASGIVTGLAFAESAAGFVYTLQQVNGGANQIHGFSIDPNTGALVPLAGFPMSSGGTGSEYEFIEHIAYSHGRLYVVNDGSDTLTAFKVDRTTGALTPLGFSPVALGTGNWGCVAVHPGGSPLIVGHTSFLTSYSVGAAAMTAATGSPFATGAAVPYSCRFSHDGNHVYAGGGSGTGIAGFAVNAATGTLTVVPGSPFNSGGFNPGAYATDSSGRLFTTTDHTPSLVRAFAISAGALVASQGNPFATGLTSGIHGVYHPSGYYMVSDPLGDRVGVYRTLFSGASTVLAAVGGSPFSASVNADRTNALALTDDGRFLVAANGWSRNLSVFKVNALTGFLGIPTVQSPNTLGTQGLITGLTFAPAAPAFTDEPVIPASGVIRASHIIELRTRIDAVRARYGMMAYAYTQPAPIAGATVIQAADVEELRAALGEVYTALGITPPSYTDPSLPSGSIVVKAVHITELRAAVIAIE